MGFFSKLKHGFSTIGKFVGKTVLNNVKTVARAVEASALSTVGVDLAKGEKFQQEQARTALLRAQAKIQADVARQVSLLGQPQGGSLGLPFPPMYLLIGLLLYVLLKRT